MSVHKTSAVADEPIDVLIALHPKFDLLDLTGPMKVFTTAAHDFNDESEYTNTRHSLRLLRHLVASLLTPCPYNSQQGL